MKQVALLLFFLSFSGLISNAQTHLGIRIGPSIGFHHYDVVESRPRLGYSVGLCVSHQMKHFFYSFEFAWDFRDSYRRDSTSLPNGQVIWPDKNGSEGFQCLSVPICLGYRTLRRLSCSVALGINPYFATNRITTDALYLGDFSFGNNNTPANKFDIGGLADVGFAYSLGHRLQCNLQIRFQRGLFGFNYYRYHVQTQGIYALCGVSYKL